MSSFLKSRKLGQLGGHRGWTAIFFGESSLDLTTVRASGGSVNPADQASAPFPPSEEVGDAQSRWRAAVKDLRQKLKPHEHRFVTAVRGEDVLCQTLRLPSTQVDELKQMLDLQIDSLTPLPIEEVVYSFEPLETAANETLVLVAIAPKAAVNERVEVLESAGLPPEVVGIDVLAVFRGFVRNQLLPGDGKLNAFVQINPAAANVVVYSRNMPVAIRSVVLGPSAISTEEGRAAFCEELRRTLVAAEANQPDREAGCVTLATWTEALRADVEALARDWQGETQCYTNGAVPLPAASLCVETAKAEGLRLNLLPDEWRQRRRAARQRRRLIAAGIALGAIYVLGLIVFLSLLALQRSRLNGVKDLIAQQRKPYNDARELNSLLGTMQKQLDTRYSALESLREVCAVMPENVKLTGFSFKKDQTVTLRGSAQSATIVTDFDSQLEHSDLFSLIKPGNMRTDPNAGGLTRFEVVCTLKSAAPVPVGAAIWR